jgi:hypothetical protein
MENTLAYGVRTSMTMIKKYLAQKNTLAYIVRTPMTMVKENT